MQFWAAMTPKDFAQPEKDLMLAILTGAISDYKEKSYSTKYSVPRCT